MLDQLTISDFQALISDTFILQLNDAETMNLELTEVAPLGAAPDGDLIRRQAFSCIFRGPAEPVLMQQICTLQHEHIGEMALFMVPVGPDGQGMRYEVIFT